MVNPNDDTFALPEIESATKVNDDRKSKGESKDDKKKEVDTSVGFVYLMAAACTSLSGPDASEATAELWHDGARELRKEETRRKERWAKWADEAGEREEFALKHHRKLLKDSPAEMDAEHKNFTVGQVKRYRSAVRYAERIREPQRALALLPPSAQLETQGTGAAQPTERPSSRAASRGNTAPKTPAEKLSALEMLEADDDDDDNGRSGGRKKGFWKEDKKKGKDKKGKGKGKKEGEKEKKKKKKKR